MGKPFAKVHACSVGKFDEGDKFPQWVRANGGEFHREVDERTTHLIATKDAYKRDVDAGMRIFYISNRQTMVF